ncbi:hypothetical protein E4U49_002159 [Claviceps purpurea]|nr:hypothetical protein E4U49_002159 [Claviceps purpurea]
MRERITFVHPPGADIDPSSLKLSQHELHGPSITAVREDRLTIALDELPPDLAKLLPRFHELSLRWASPLAYHTVDPFTSRTSPGLHLSYALASAEDTDAEQKVCDALLALGLGDCASSEAFTIHGEGKFKKPPGATLHEHLEHLSPLTSGAAKGLCVENDTSCQARLEEFSGASVFDVSWDADAHAVRVGALFPLNLQDIHVSGIAQRRTEVGLLSKDTPPSQEPHELGVSGLLAVLGENKEPSGTMFAFPSRHRSSEASFTSRFVEPTGLHPVLQLNVTSNKAPVADEHCAPFAYLTLPKTIFADRYQLADELLLAANNLAASRYTSLPVDLEAPAYTTKVWGSSVLLELAPPAGSDGDDESVAWTAKVPLHLRYLSPSSTGNADIEVPYPAVFWACESAAKADFANNPFDRTSVGYDALFSSSTVFWHAEPEPVSGDNRLMSAITVPVLKEEAAAWIGVGTTVVVVLGFAWVLWTLFMALWRSGYGARGQTKGEESNESKKRR